MNFITRFFRTIKNSLYSPSFYKEVPTRPLSSAIGYFTVLSILCLAVIMCFEGPLTVKKVHEARELVVTHLVEGFPADLEVAVVKGKITSNVQGEMLFELPEGEYSFGQKKEVGVPEHFLTINTGIPVSLEAWQQADTSVLIASDGIAFDDRGSMKVLPASELPDMTINKAQVNKYYIQFQPFIEWIPAIAVLIVMLAYFMSLAANFLFAFLIAVLVLIVAHNTRRPLHYAGAYKITLHAMTLSLFWMIAEGLGAPAVPFLFTILTSIVALANLLGSPAVPPPPPSAPIAPANSL